MDDLKHGCKNEARYELTLYFYAYVACFNLIVEGILYLKNVVPIVFVRFLLNEIATNLCKGNSSNRLP